MISTSLLFILAAGVPYYFLLEKVSFLKSKQIFLLSAFLFLLAIIGSKFVVNEYSIPFIAVALVSAIVSIYKATKTTNFYKLAYYLLFVNAPFFLLFEDEAAMYSISLLVTLSGLFLTGKFYEKHYGSANYHHITGITLVRPYIGTYLTFYLIALALYPPFPNSLYFLSYIFNSEPGPLWYIVIITLFFGNFFLAMRVMKKTLFGRPNSNIHYVHMTPMEKATHMSILVLLLLLSLNGFKELLS